MDDGFFSGFILLLLFGLAIFGVVFMLTSTTDSTVISNCEKNGWHNFGQTRIICSVEKKEGK